MNDRVDAWEARSNLTDLVSFLRSLFSADPGIVSRAKNKPVFASFRKALAVCLRTDAPLSLKNEAFDIIPMYICIEGEHVDEVGKTRKGPESAIKNHAVDWPMDQGYCRPPVPVFVQGAESRNRSVCKTNNCLCRN